MTFVHEALYYATADEFLTGTLDFVRAGLAAGEPTLIAVPQPRLALLQAQLGPPSAADRSPRPSGGPSRGGRRPGGPSRGGPSTGAPAAASGSPVGETQPGVWFADMGEAGRNPARLLPWVLSAFAGRNAGRVRIVGEPIFVGRTPDELGPCIEHEALINVAFNGSDARILCPYDTGQLADLIPYAERTHPIIVRAGRRRPSHDYTDPAKVVAMVNRSLPEPGRVDERFVFDLRGLAGVRRLVGAHAEGAGLSADRIGDLQLAVTEICTNAVVHVGAGDRTGSDGGRDTAEDGSAGAGNDGRLGSARLWTDGDRVVCEIRGPGQIMDIMAGRVIPPAGDPAGRGLLLAHRLCDLVQIHTASSGTTTRLYMRVSVS